MYNSKPKFSAHCGSLLFIILLTFSFKTASAEKEISILQITNVRVTTASDMFKFSPNLVQIQPGEKLVFTNSMAHHTVHSVPVLWPDSVKKLKISNKPRVEVSLDKEGFYGFTCRRHGVYGMTLLVVVGNPEGVNELKSKIKKMRAKSREKRAFEKLVDRYLKNDD